MKHVIPYIKTSGSEKYKNFIAAPFTVDMLYPVFNEKSCETLFDGWHGKNMTNWYRFTNDNKICLEFYPSHYTVGKEQQSFKPTPNTIKFTLPLPQTINEFINDMNRYNVELLWTEYINEIFEPKEYMASEDIRNYYVDLLGKLGKSHELL